MYVLRTETSITHSRRHNRLNLREGWFGCSEHNFVLWMDNLHYIHIKLHRSICCRRRGTKWSFLKNAPLLNIFSYQPYPYRKTFCHTLRSFHTMATYWLQYMNNLLEPLNGLILQHRWVKKFPVSRDDIFFLKIEYFKFSFKNEILIFLEKYGVIW